MCFEFVVLLLNLIFFLVDGFLPNPDHRFGLFQVGLNLHVGCNHVICLCQFYFSVDQRKLAKSKIPTFTPHSPLGAYSNVILYIYTHIDSAMHIVNKKTNKQKNKNNKIILQLAYVTYNNCHEEWQNTSEFRLRQPFIVHI